MSAVTAERSAEVREILERVVRWAEHQPHVVAIALVGSWARGAATMRSDLDLVLVSDDPAVFTDVDGWWSFLGDATIARKQMWGMVAERRLRLASGFEVELDIAPLGWASVPVDAGTRRVLADGVKVLLDRAGLLGAALAASRR